MPRTNTTNDWKTCEVEYGFVNYKKSFNARKCTKKVITKPIIKKNQRTTEHSDRDSSHHIPCIAHGLFFVHQQTWN